MSVSVIPWGTQFALTPAGSQLELIYIVTGLDPSNPDNTVLACNAIDTDTGVRIPQYQSPHPSIQGLAVSAVNSIHLGTEESPNRSACKVKVTFGTADFLPNSTLIEIGSINGTKLINRWPYGPLKGKPILVGISVGADDGKIIHGPSYDYPDQIDVTGLDTRTNVPIGGTSTQFFYNRYYDTVEIPTLSSATLLIFTRRETEAPIVGRYKLKASSNAWQGLRAGEWFCRNVTAKNIIGVGNVFPGGGYEVRYEFQSADELDLPEGLSGFTRVEFYKDPISGKPVAGTDCTDGSNNGYTLFRPFDSFNFDELNLPVVWTNFK